MEEGENLYCKFIDTNLYLYSYWWLLIIIQLVAPIFPIGFWFACIDRICSCFGVNDCWDKVGMSGDNFVTFVFQSSFWSWTWYLISSGCCGSREYTETEPLFITAVVFAVITYLMSIFGFCMSDEDNAVMRKTTPEDFYDYLERVRNMAPRDMISGNSYHYELVAAPQRKTREECVTSYEGSEIFHYDKWLDLTDWSVADIGLSKKYLTIYKFTFDIQPGDEYTQHEIETWYTNYESYVSSIDAHTGKFQHKIQVFFGYNPVTFKEKFCNKKEVLKGEIANVFSVINSSVDQPWYVSRVVLIIFTILGLSVIVKMLVSISSRHYEFVVKKVFFSNPRSPFTDYSFIKNPVVPYTGPGRGEMPLLSSVTTGRTYERVEKEVEQRPAIMEPGLNPSKPRPWTLISFYDDILTMENVQNY